MFATTLEQRGIKKNRPLIAFFDDKNNTIDVIENHVLRKKLTTKDGNFRPFGCYWKDKNIFIATHNKLVQLNKKGNLISEEELEGFYNTHQIIETDKVRCYTNTGHDLIKLIYKNKIKIIDCKILNETYNSNKDDSHHVNSLCLKDDKIFFCLHNNSVTTKKPSQFFYIDLITDNIEYICEYGLSCHNCEIEGDFLYTLSTETGCFACINWKTKEIKFEVNLVKRKHYFLRGLQLTKNNFIIGASSSVTPRAEILFVNRDTKKIDKKYYIENFNTILDIKSF
jgi:hypothetical protein